MSKTHSSVLFGLFINAIELVVIDHFVNSIYCGNSSFQMAYFVSLNGRESFPRAARCEGVGVFAVVTLGEYVADFVLP